MSPSAQFDLPGGINKKRSKSCCGIVEGAAESSREKRASRVGPTPWIARKLVVGVTLGIIGYTAYVYTRILCFPMIRRSDDATASRATGIALLTVFYVLFLWLMWAYAKIVFTSPGYAKDHVQKSDRPLIPASFPIHNSLEFTDLSHNPNSDTHPASSRSHSSQYPPPQRSREFNGFAGPSYEDILKRDGKKVRTEHERTPLPTPMTPAVPPSPTKSSEPTAHDKSLATGNLKSTLKLKKQRPPDATLISLSMTRKQEKLLERENRLILLHVDRRPPTTPVLDPVHRYCSTEEFVKPYRAHHCRNCGTCVLKFDHHCPWIGQCVGARNHKFFMNFCLSASIITAYTFGSLLAYTEIASSISTAGSSFAQEIAIIVLSGLFFMFSFTMITTHTYMITNGQSTLEHLQISSMKNRETIALQRGFSWWEVGAKRRKRKEWDYEWGRLNKEGNIWWRGNAREEWVDVMGTNWLGWIFPIGRGLNNGLKYPVNRRFDPEGRWQRRPDWPEDLR